MSLEQTDLIDGLVDGGKPPLRLVIIDLFGQEHAAVRGPMLEQKLRTYASFAADEVRRRSLSPSTPVQIEVFCRTAPTPDMLDFRLVRTRTSPALTMELTFTLRSKDTGEPTPATEASAQPDTAEAKAAPPASVPDGAADVVLSDAAFLSDPRAPVEPTVLPKGMPELRSAPFYEPAGGFVEEGESLTDEQVIELAWQPGKEIPASAVTEESFWHSRRVRACKAAVARNLFLPVLRPGGWPNPETFLTHDLISPEASKDKRVPLVLFGVDQDAVSVQMGAAAAEARGLTAQNAMEIAVSNLRRRNRRDPWTTVPAKNLILFYREGDQYTAADVLDREYMMEVHERLGRTDLVVGMPSLNVLYVGSFDCLMQISLMTFVTHVQAAKEGLAALCGYPIILTNGVPKQFFPMSYSMLEMLARAAKLPGIPASEGASDVHHDDRSEEDDADDDAGDGYGGDDDESAAYNDADSDDDTDSDYGKDSYADDADSDDDTDSDYGKDSYADDTDSDEDGSSRAEKLAAAQQCLEDLLRGLLKPSSESKRSSSGGASDDDADDSDESESDESDDNSDDSDNQGNPRKPNGRPRR